jgi:hypothetical protein
VLSGHALSLHPTILAGRIAWTCGFANVEGEDPGTGTGTGTGTGAAGRSRTDIDARDLHVLLRVSALFPPS